MKVMRSFGHKAVILSLCKLNIKSKKTSFTKIAQSGMLVGPKFLDQRFYWTQKNFRTQISLITKILSDQEIFSDLKFFWTKIFPQNFFQTKIFRTQIFFWKYVSDTNFFLDPEFFMKKFFDAKFIKPFQAEHFRLSLVSDQLKPKPSWTINWWDLNEKKIQTNNFLRRGPISTTSPAPVGRLSSDYISL